MWIIHAGTWKNLGGSAWWYEVSYSPVTSTTLQLCEVHHLKCTSWRSHGLRKVAVEIIIQFIALTQMPMFFSGKCLQGRKKHPGCWNIGFHSIMSLCLSRIKYHEPKSSWQEQINTTSVEARNEFRFVGSYVFFRLIFVYFGDSWHSSYCGFICLYVDFYFHINKNQLCRLEHVSQQLGCSFLTANLGLTKIQAVEERSRGILATSRIV